MPQMYCDLCGSENVKLYCEIPDLWLDRFSAKSRFFICDECGLIYQHPKPLLQDFQELYPESYTINIKGQDRYLKLGLLKRSQCILNLKKRGKLLDIGAASGEFIEFMRDRYQWDVVGIEPNSWLAQHARDKYNLHVIDGSLEQTNFPDHSFDVVTLWDVLEHLHNPKNTLREIHRILRPNGILVLRLPNLDSIDAKLFGKYWAGFDSPRHLYIFSKATIQLLLAQTGFTLIKLNTNIGGYLNMVKSIQFWLTGMGVRLSVRKMLLWILKTPPVRIIAAPFVWLKDQDQRGSEMVVIALPTIGKNLYKKQ